MRPDASVMHLDLDAFFASVEQRDKPSLRGKPVVVGGVGGRGVVATASYEARRYGVRSAMSTREARARCPHAAFLNPRFHAYREASQAVMAVLRDLSPLVEPLSLDEAFVDLAVSELTTYDEASVRALAERVRAAVTEVTGGLTASVGVATSKFVAKVASDLDKPDGLVVVPAGTELDLLRPMHVTVIPGVGPATAERLRRAGITTVADLERVSEDELVRLLGKAHGHGLHLLARAEDDRAVVPERETKSVSVEGTYDTDLTDPRLMAGLVTRQAANVAERLRSNGLSGRTVTLKVRLHDFTTLSRSTTLPPRPTRRRPSPGSPAGCSASSTPPAACACSASGCPGSRTGSRRTSSATTRTSRPRRSRSTEPARAPRDPRLVAGHGRRARGPRTRLGVGRRPRHRHRPLRDRRDPAGAGALAAGRRPRAQRLAAGVKPTASPGLSCAHCHRSRSSTTATTG